MPLQCVPRILVLILQTFISLYYSYLFLQLDHRLCGDRDKGLFCSPDHNECSSVIETCMKQMVSNKFMNLNPKLSAGSFIPQYNSVLGNRGTELTIPSYTYKPKHVLALHRFMYQL